MPDSPLLFVVNADKSVEGARKDKWDGPPYTKKLKAKKNPESELNRGDLYLAANPSANVEDAIDATIVLGPTDTPNDGLAGSTIIDSNTMTTCKIIYNKLV